jgi:hypothetical protein
MPLMRAECPAHLTLTHQLSNIWRRVRIMFIARWGVKVITCLHLLPRSRVVDLYLHSPMRLHGVVLN